MFNFSREDTGVAAKWWRNVDKQILFSFIFLFLLGLFFSFSSTTSLMSEKMNKQTYFFFVKHLIFVFIALSLLILISMQKKDELTKFLFFFFFASILILALVPIFGIEIKGSKRWLNLPILPAFQPVELVKPLFVIFVAKIIVLDEKKRFIIDTYILFCFWFLFHYF